MKSRVLIFLMLCIAALVPLGLITGCSEKVTVMPPVKTVPHEAPWGIYKLDLATLDISLIYSSPADFLCHHPSFSSDDAGIYFLGQWWEVE